MAGVILLPYSLAKTEFQPPRNSTSVLWKLYFRFAETLFELR